MEYKQKLQVFIKDARQVEAINRALLKCELEEKEYNENVKDAYIRYLLRNGGPTTRTQEEVRRELMDLEMVQSVTPLKGSQSIHNEISNLYDELYAIKYNMYEKEKELMKKTHNENIKQYTSFDKFNIDEEIEQICLDAQAEGLEIAENIRNDRRNKLKEMEAVS